MGLIGRLFGGAGAGAVESLGDTAGDLAEVFRPNATRQMELAHAARVAAQHAHAAEFEHGGATWFDRAVNGLNRLPRPAMALGTVGLFAHAMADPEGFARRMQGLGHVPDPLWWLLGAVVSFYFGARELHYRRAERARTGGVSLMARAAGLFGGGGAADAPGDMPDPGARFPDNAALADWARARGRRRR